MFHGHSGVPPFMKKMFLKIPLLTTTLFPEIETMLAAWDWGSEPWIPLSLPSNQAPQLDIPFLPWDKPWLPKSPGLFGKQGKPLLADGEIPHGGCPAPYLLFLQLGRTSELLSSLLFVSCLSPNTWGDQTLHTFLGSDRLAEQGAELPEDGLSHVSHLSQALTALREHHRTCTIISSLLFDLSNIKIYKVPLGSFPLGIHFPFYLIFWMSLWLQWPVRSIRGRAQRTEILK